MTTAARTYFTRAHRKVDGLTPPIRTALQDAYRSLIRLLPQQQIVRLLELGAVDPIINAILSDAVLDATFRTTRARVERAVTSVADSVTRTDLPRARDVTWLTNERWARMSMRFDPKLNFNVHVAIQALDDALFPTLKGEIRETVRQEIDNGLEAGLSPLTIARRIKSVVGLSPAQALAIENYRKELEAGDKAAAEARVLHNQRFSITPDMSAAKIDRMVESYRQAMLGYHAETISRTATIGAYKRGQRIAWETAIGDGRVERERVLRQWMGVGDDRERDSHVEMNDTIVGFDEPYPNGQMVPGEGEYNCRCLDRVFIAPVVQVVPRPIAPVEPPPWAFKGAPLEHTETVARIEDARRTFEDGVRTNSFESAAAWAADGTEIMHKAGEQHSVWFTPDEQERLKHAYLFTHNHPSGGPFSDQDLITQRILDIERIRAFGVDKLSKQPVEYESRRIGPARVGELDPFAMRMQIEALVKVFDDRAIIKEAIRRGAPDPSTSFMLSDEEVDRANHLVLEIIHERLEKYLKQEGLYAYGRVVPSSAP